VALFSRKSKATIQEQISPLIAASYIEQSWNNEQRADRGLQVLTMSNRQIPHTPDRFTNSVLLLPTVVAFWFLDSFAFRYLGLDRDRFGIFWPRREWLYVHIVAGTIALLLGPVQLWLGLNRRAPIAHRILGVSYVLGVFVSGSTALYLALHTDFGWVFGMGLTAMSLAWMISTFLATMAICFHLVEQHREWMIRSYVLTFGFITFRVVTDAFQAAGAGTTIEQMTAASWFSWSVPLLITEWVIQGRKILAHAQQKRAVFPRKPYRIEAVQLEIFDRASL